jgi:DNA-binding CsgD family transcriptional regulator
VSDDVADGSGVRPQLTRREFEVGRLVAEGHSHKEAAEILSTTTPAIMGHVANVYRKLGARNRVEMSLTFKKFFPPELTRPAAYAGSTRSR